LAPPTQDSSITLNEKLQLVHKVLKHDERKRRTIYLFDAKEHFRTLHVALGVTVGHGNAVKDPKVAHWLLRPIDKERPLAGLAAEWSPQRLTTLLAHLGQAKGCGSPALDVSSTTPARTRASVEAALVFDLMTSMECLLREEEAAKTFCSVEMPAVMSLARMELNGIGFDVNEAERQRDLLQAALDALEAEAYALAKRPFSLTSPEDICRVLYKELRLPLNGEKSRSSKTKPSSAKDILIKLKAHHALPGIILDWRKLNMALTKVSPIPNTF
jgi:DNA polymerase I-like protein with 3'-5' exonuclease and polymerase domains